MTRLKELAKLVGNEEMDEVRRRNLLRKVDIA